MTEQERGGFRSRVFLTVEGCLAPAARTLWSSPPEIILAVQPPRGVAIALTERSASPNWIAGAGIMDAERTAKLRKSDPAIDWSDVTEKSSLIKPAASRPVIAGDPGGQTAERGAEDVQGQRERIDGQRYGWADSPENGNIGLGLDHYPGAPFPCVQGVCTMKIATQPSEAISDVSLWNCLVSAEGLEPSTP
jgi:hypothetical protein